MYIALFTLKYLPVWITISSDKVFRQINNKGDFYSLNYVFVLHFYGTSGNLTLAH